MKKALVTGATGFLGKALAFRLRNLGWNVTAFGRNENVGNYLQSRGIHFFQGDLMDKTAVSKACSGQDIVFHSAALSSPWGRYEDFYNSNVIGTQHIIDACFSHEVSRLVHVSTPSIYFNFQDQLDIPENARLPKKPANHYAATKRIAETLVLHAHQNGLPSIIIRPRAIFGPGDNALFPRLIRANENGGVPIFRRGQVKMDITYIDNVVDALLLCANASEEALGYAYNITNQEPVIFVEVLRQIFEQINQPLKLRATSVSYRRSVRKVSGNESEAVSSSQGAPDHPLFRCGVKQASHA